MFQCGYENVPYNNQIFTKNYATIYLTFDKN